MNDAAWWARVVKARTERADLMPQRVWALRKDGHQAAIDVRRYPASVRKTCSRLTASPLWTRLFRGHQQDELSGAIANRRPRSRQGGVRETNILTPSRFTVRSRCCRNRG